MALKATSWTSCLPIFTMNEISETMFIFLDDVRDPPSESWMVVRSAPEAYQAIIVCIALNQKMVLSLDHDLGKDIPTGYDLLNWIEKDIVTSSTFRPDISFCIHSANPVGRDNMARAIRSIEELLS